MGKCANITQYQAIKGWDNKDLLNHQHQIPLVETEKSSRKIRQSLSAISSKDFLLQWRSSKARCFSCSRSFFIRLLCNRIQATTINLIHSINSKSNLDRTIFVAYCHLGVKLLCCPSEWVSVTIKSSPQRTLLISIWCSPIFETSPETECSSEYFMKCCLDISLGPVWFKTIFWVITGAVSYIQL